MPRSICCRSYPQVILRDSLLTDSESAGGLKIFSSLAGATSDLPKVAASCNLEGFFSPRGKWTLSKGLTTCWVDNTKVTVAMKRQTRRKTASSCIYWITQFLLMHNRSTVCLTARSQVHVLLQPKAFTIAKDLALLGYNVCMRNSSIPRVKSPKAGVFSFHFTWLEFNDQWSTYRLRPPWKWSIGTQAMQAC